jgi:hypothetical protein
LLALAELAADEGRHDEALSMLDEATRAAAAGEAHGIQRWIDEARARLT